MAAGHARHHLDQEGLMDKRTIDGWCHALNEPGGELTLSEFMAKCLLDIRDNAVLSRLAQEHVEGMLGTLDTTLDQRDELYHHFAERRAARATDARQPELTGAERG
jgi:hypothetical protein